MYTLKEKTKTKDVFTHSTKRKAHNKKARSQHDYSNPFTKMIHISGEIHLSTAIFQILQDVLSIEERTGEHVHAIFRIGQQK